MLLNVYINKILAMQCLDIISLYLREGFFHPFNFFVVSKGILFTSNFKTARRKRFFNGATCNWFLYMLLCKKKNYMSVNQ